MLYSNGQRKFKVESQKLGMQEKTDKEFLQENSSFVLFNNYYWLSARHEPYNTSIALKQSEKRLLNVTVKLKNKIFKFAPISDF